PVTIDPTLVYGRASDTYTQASNPDSNFGGSAGLLTGTTNGGGDRSRSMVTFTTSSLTGRHILSATLGVWNYASGACLNSGTSSNPMVVHRITSAWDPATVTWNTTGFTYAATVSATVNRSLQPNNPSCPVGTVYADVTGLVQAWVDGTVPNYGLL